MVDEIEQSETILGRNPWQNGFRENLPALKALDGSILKRGMISQPTEFRALFAQSTLEAFKI
jgi:hypothetical protein